MTNFSDVWNTLHTSHGRAAIVGDNKYTDEEYSVCGLPFAELINSINTLSDKNVLDYGCGDGRIARHVAPLCKNLVCADASSVILNKCREVVPSAEFFNVNFPSEIQKLEYFDVIYSLAVIYHLTDIETYRVLSEFKKLLKPEGVIIIDFCNIFNPLYVETLRNKIELGDWKNPWPWVMQNGDSLEYISKYILKFKEVSIINEQCAQPIFIIWGK